MSENPLNHLDREVEPPPELEKRVVRELTRRGLIAPRPGKNPWFGWYPLGGLAAAASLALLVGFALGRTTAQPVISAESTTDRYALLLYETEGYRPASGSEELERYREYSRWVAEARRRDQFVTGEDLEVAGGWVLGADGAGAAAKPVASASHAAALSGVFLITASSDGQALALAERLPHLAHGGQVVVQRVLPTDTPPELNPS